MGTRRFPAEYQSAHCCRNQMDNALSGSPRIPKGVDVISKNKGTRRSLIEMHCNPTLFTTSRLFRGRFCLISCADCLHTAPS